MDGALGTVAQGYTPVRLVAAPDGIMPQLSDAELVTLSVMQAFLGRVNGARRLRFAREQLSHLFQ